MGALMVIFSLQPKQRAKTKGKGAACLEHFSQLSSSKKCLESVEIFHFPEGLFAFRIVACWFDDVPPPSHLASHPPKVTLVPVEVTLPHQQCTRSAVSWKLDGKLFIRFTPY